MTLATETRGPASLDNENGNGTGSGPGTGAGSGAGRHRLILAHGFTQNARCWGAFADHLADEHELTLVDAPGHGRSGHDDANLWAAADLLTEVGGRGVYVGYSMGGRTALHAALTHPDLVDGLVLIGATPGLTEAEDRAERRRADDDLAERLVEFGLPAFLDRWLALPLFAGLDDEAAARSARLTNRPDGLAASLRHCGTGSQEPLWGRLGEIEVPVLAVVGDQDHKFTAIAERMTAGLTATTAEVLVLPGTHAVHLERPRECATAIAERIATWSTGR